MPAALPASAPFSGDDAAALDQVIGRSSPTQRAWLAGFLAGLDANAGTAPANDAKPSEPITIVYASESGNSERVAHDLAKAARRRGAEAVRRRHGRPRRGDARGGGASRDHRRDLGRGRAARPREARLRRADGGGRPPAGRRPVRRARARRHVLCRVLRDREADRRAPRRAWRHPHRRPDRPRPRLRRTRRRLGRGTRSTRSRRRARPATSSPSIFPRAGPRMRAASRSRRRSSTTSTSTPRAPTRRRFTSRLVLTR